MSRAWRTFSGLAICLAVSFVGGLLIDRTIGGPVGIGASVVLGGVIGYIGSHVTMAWADRAGDR